VPNSMRRPLQKQNDYVEDEEKEIITAMTFMASTPDLTGTIFTETDLTWARTYLWSLIPQVDSEWLNTPQGLFGDYWFRDDPYATCSLIELARMIDVVWEHIPSSAHARFKEKIKAILCPPAIPQQFSENLTELQMASTLVRLVGYLFLEPLVSRSEFSTRGQQSRSPDFAFDLPEERIYVEGTVFYVDLLDKWERDVEQIATILQNRLFKKRRSLHLSLQLALQPLDVKQITNRVWSKMSEVEEGEISVIGKGVIQWMPYRITALADDASAQQNSLQTSGLSLSQYQSFNLKFHPSEDGSPGTIHFSSTGISHTANIQVDQIYLGRYDISLLSTKDQQEANEAVFRSLRNKLRHKREQFSLDHPYLLTIRLGHYRLDHHGLRQMIEERIWRNPVYRWITGIVFFTPRFGYLQSHSEPYFMLYPNPCAHRPASESLKALFSQQGKYLLP
jgi:hypothetical protein